MRIFAILLGILAGAVLYVTGIVALCWIIDSNIPHEGGLDVEYLRNKSNLSQISRDAWAQERQMGLAACCEARGCENCK